MANNAFFILIINNNLYYLNSELDLADCNMEHFKLYHNWSIAIIYKYCLIEACDKSHFLCQGMCEQPLPIPP